MMTKIVRVLGRTLILIITISLFSFSNSKEVDCLNISREKSVIFVVEKMTCVSCPYIVKTSLINIDGVKDVKVALDEKKAFVVFDETKTTIGKLIEATTNVGFPSKLFEAEND